MRLTLEEYKRDNWVHMAFRRNNIENMRSDYMNKRVLLIIFLFPGGTRYESVELTVISLCSVSMLQYIYYNYGLLSVLLADSSEFH